MARRVRAILQRVAQSRCRQTRRSPERRRDAHDERAARACLTKRQPNDRFRHESPCAGDDRRRRERPSRSEAARAPIAPADESRPNQSKPQAQSSRNARRKTASDRRAAPAIACASADAEDRRRLVFPHSHKSAQRQTASSSRQTARPAHAPAPTARLHALASAGVRIPVRVQCESTTNVALIVPRPVEPIEANARDRQPRNSSMQRFVVNADWHGVRVDRFLDHALPRTVTKSLVQKSIRLGKIRIGVVGAEVSSSLSRVKHSDRVANGQQIFVPLSIIQQQNATKSIPVPTAADIEFAKRLILLEHRDFVAINKPRGLASQGGVGVIRHVGTQLFPALQHVLGDPELPRIVHRLDRDASGVLVFARSRAAAAALSRSLADHRWNKQYVALVRGAPSQQEGSIQNRLLKYNDPRPRDAITEFRVLEQRAGLALISLSPRTGRQHQLRIHCAQSLRSPILGDTKYGDRGLESGEKHLFLHSWRLELPLLTDSDSKKSITIEAPIPLEFLERIRNSPT